MKFLKIKVKIDNIGGKTHYSYPQPEYDMLKIVFGPLYEGGLEDNLPDIWARGSKEHSFEYILVGAKNENIEQALANPDIEELVEEDFRLLGNKWHGPAVEKITDDKKVLSVVAKFVRGDKLEQEDLDVLDPNSSVKGITKSLSFDERLNISKTDFPN